MKYDPEVYRFMVVKLQLAHGGFSYSSNTSSNTVLSRTLRLSNKKPKKVAITPSLSRCNAPYRLCGLSHFLISGDESHFG